MGRALKGMFLTEELRVAIAKNLFVQWVEDNSNDDLAEAKEEFNDETS